MKPLSEAQMQRCAEHAEREGFTLSFEPFSYPAEPPSKMWPEGTEAQNGVGVKLATEGFEATLPLSDRLSEDDITARLDRFLPHVDRKAVEAAAAGDS